MVNPAGNIGDGVIRCKDAVGAISDENLFPEMGVEEVHGDFPVRRLDEVLLELSQKGLAQEFDFVKIDVEGYENMVFEGAGEFLSKYHPRIIKTEAWPKMVGPDGEMSGVQYLERFEKAGYRLFRSPDCTTPMNNTESMVELAMRETTDIFACIAQDTPLLQKTVSK